MFLLLRNLRYEFNRPYSRLRGNDKNYCLRDIKFPPCPPHKHNVFVGAPGAGNDRVFVVRWVLYYLADETPGITGMMVPPGLGTGIVAVGL